MEQKIIFMCSWWSMQQDELHVLVMGCYKRTFLITPWRVVQQDRFSVLVVDEARVRFSCDGVCSCKGEVQGWSWWSMKQDVFNAFVVGGRVGQFSYVCAG